MEDNLKLLCDQYRIKLIYTDNKITVLTTNCNQNKPTIRINKLFENCPENIAYAVIKYCISYFPKDQDSYNLIAKYTIDRFRPSRFVIKPPDYNFALYFLKDIDTLLLNSLEESKTRIIKNQSEEIKNNQIFVDKSSDVELKIIVEQ
jgi:hypothetical protein